MHRHRQTLNVTDILIFFSSDIVIIHSTRRQYALCINFTYSETTRRGLSFTSMKLNNKILWAIGLLESDGYIGFNLVKKNTYIFTVKVSLKSYNMRAIYKLKNLFGIGKIHKSSDGMVTWKVTRFDQIKTIMLPLFILYEFRGLKAYDVIIMREAVSLYESDISVEEKTILLTELKLKRSKNQKNNISPFWHQKLNLNIDESIFTVEDYINLVPSREVLKNLIDPDWLAGFVEGDGSFQINNRLQNVFELGQKYNIFLVLCIHKFLGIESKPKIRKDLSYTMLSTKQPKTLDLIDKLLTGRILGIKSFELRLWKYAKDSEMKHKKERAKILLKKIRARTLNIDKE